MDDRIVFELLATDQLERLEEHPTRYSKPVLAKKPYKRYPRTKKQQVVRYQFGLAHMLPFPLY